MRRPPVIPMKHRSTEAHDGPLTVLLLVAASPLLQSPPDDDSDGSYYVNDYDSVPGIVLLPHWYDTSVPYEYEYHTRTVMRKALESRQLTGPL
jgi:hypothetical protein